jgi:hypothetical protein
VRKLKLINIVLLFSSQLVGQSQLPSPKQVNNFEHLIGMVANGTGDFGMIYQLSYRLFYKNTGVNFTVYPFFSDYLNEYNLGLTFMYRFYQKDKVELLIIQNNYYFESDEYVSEHFYPNGYFSNGLGIEADFIVKRNFNIDLMFGGSFYKNFESIVPFFGLGFHYKL